MAGGLPPPPFGGGSGGVVPWLRQTTDGFVERYGSFVWQCSAVASSGGVVVGDDSVWAFFDEQQWIQIIAQLSVADVVAASAVSKDFRLFATSSFIWARLYASRWSTELPNLLQKLTTSYWHAYRDRMTAEREHRVLVLACTLNSGADCTLAFGRLDALSMGSKQMK